MKTHSFNATDLSQIELMNIEGGFIQYWAAACAVAYYAGYAAHAIYDYYN